MKRYIETMLIVAIMFLLGSIQAQASSLRAALDPSIKTITRTGMTLPASTQTSIFTISGAPIHVLSLVGEVTTVIQTQPCSLKIVADPTTPATDTDLSAALEITGDAVGTYYSMVTSIATALAEYTNGVGPTMAGVFGVTVPIGNIDVNTNATNTGAITWRMEYRPWPGAHVTAE